MREDLLTESTERFDISNQSHVNQQLVIKTLLKEDDPRRRYLFSSLLDYGCRARLKAVNGVKAKRGEDR